jgi:hypothetical protein
MAARLTRSRRELRIEHLKRHKMPLAPPTPSLVWNMSLTLAASRPIHRRNTPGILWCEPGRVDLKGTNPDGQWLFTSSPVRAWNLQQHVNGSVIRTARHFDLPRQSRVHQHHHQRQTVARTQYGTCSVSSGAGTDASLLLGSAGGIGRNTFNLTLSRHQRRLRQQHPPVGGQQHRHDLNTFQPR